MAADDLALRIGTDPAAYVRMEAAGTWTGSDRQAYVRPVARWFRCPKPAYRSLSRGCTATIRG
ncbi:hypothetical protein [Streptomyces rimosus]|uniref:hypothetical protein n=1 Tax=Streptomyces rimosus TaxID=1927 RepID=UPI00067AE38E|nr:hypothetical protein [Streptomyces rimosus]